MTIRKKTHVGASNINPSPVHAGSNQEVGPAVQPVPTDNIAAAWAAVTAQANDLPPAQGAPATPTKFIPLTGVEVHRLSKVSTVQESTVQAFMADVQRLVAAGRYETVFSNRVPAKVLLAMLDRAAAWSAEASSADRWNNYAQNQRGVAWDDAMTVIVRFAMEYAAALHDDPHLAVEVPGMANFLGSHATAVKKGKARVKKQKVASGQPVAGARTRTRTAHVPVPVQGHPATPLTAAASQGPAQPSSPSTAAGNQGPAVNPQGPAPGR